MLKKIRTSNYEGVYWHSKHQRWAATYKREWIGLFDTEEEAKRYRDSFMKIYEKRLANGTLVNPNDAQRLRGVTRCAEVGKWRARIYAEGKMQHIGYFATKEEAAAAYDSAALGIFGHTAKINGLHASNARLS